MCVYNNNDDDNDNDDDYYYKEDDEEQWNVIGGEYLFLRSAFKKVEINFSNSLCGLDIKRPDTLPASVTRLGDFGQLFKACGINYFGHITHIFRQFL